MKAFKDYTVEEMKQFIAAYNAIADADAVIDAAPYAWAFPWYYAPEWMVEATDPAEAARLWCGIWKDIMVPAITPASMEVFA